MPDDFSLIELRALHEIARVLSRSSELKDQLQETLDVLSTRLGMERGMISVLDLQTGEAWLDVARGVDVETGQISYRPGEGITGKVAQTGRPLAIANLGKETHFLDRTGARKSLNRAELAFLCVPIFYQGRCVGILSADKLAHQVEEIGEEVKTLSAIAELLGKVVHFRAVEEENRRLRRMLAEAKRPTTSIIGRSKVIQEVLRLIDQVADTNTTVLITGETGTGKELVAKAIHENSRRGSGPMVQVNCAAMPDTLLESELFGHEKGAFTGAITRRRGRFEEAQGGTIFLDEVGELSPIAQAKLLRVLQEREFQPLGSSRTVKVDVRVITASNKDLEFGDLPGRLSPGPVLQAQCVPHLSAASARARPRHPAAGRLFRSEVRPRVRQRHKKNHHERHRHADVLPLARKRSRAGKLYRTRSSALTGKRYRLLAPAPDSADEARRHAERQPGKTGSANQRL